MVTRRTSAAAAAQVWSTVATVATVGLLRRVHVADDRATDLAVISRRAGTVSTVLAQNARFALSNILSRRWWPGFLPRRCRDSGRGAGSAVLWMLPALVVAAAHGSAGSGWCSCGPRRPWPRPPVGPRSEARWAAASAAPSCRRWRWPPMRLPSSAPPRTVAWHDVLDPLGALPDHRHVVLTRRRLPGGSTSCSAQQPPPGRGPRPRADPPAAPAPRHRVRSIVRHPRFAGRRARRERSALRHQHALGRPAPAPRGRAGRRPRRRPQPPTRALLVRRAAVAALGPASPWPSSAPGRPCCRRRGQPLRFTGRSYRRVCPWQPSTPASTGTGSVATKPSPRSCTCGRTVRPLAVPERFSPITLEPNPAARRPAPGTGSGRWPATVPWSSTTIRPRPSPLPGHRGPGRCGPAGLRLVASFPGARIYAR